MALENKKPITGDMLFADLQEHLDWFSDVIECAMFNDCQGLVSTPPSTLLVFLQEHADRIAVTEKSMHGLDSVQKGLERAAQNIESGEMTSAIFQVFKRLMNAYTQQISHIGREAGCFEGPINAETGLRNDSVMREELKREMVRLDRKNSPICIINLAVDQKNIPGKSEVYKDVAYVISDMLRAFDDAFFLGEGEFVLCLKDVDILDAGSVMERLCEKVQKVFFKDKHGNRDSISISCGLVEPVPGDNLDAVLHAARETRMEAQRDGGNLVYEYNEKSTLAKLAEHPSGNL